MTMNIREKSKNFLNFIINLPMHIRLFRPCTSRPDGRRQSQSQLELELESQSPAQLPTFQAPHCHATRPTDHQPPPSNTNVYMRKQWPLLVIGVCFAAVAAALQALQTPKPLPMTFHWFCMALELSFLCVIVSIYIRRCMQVASLVMDHAAIFLASTAFMLAVSMNSPTPLLGITAALYFIAILLIIFANILMPRDTTNP